MFVVVLVSVVAMLVVVAELIVEMQLMQETFGQSVVIEVVVPAFFEGLVGLVVKPAVATELLAVVPFVEVERQQMVLFAGDAA